VAELAKKEHILVVDDSPDTLEVLQRTLQAKGYEVYTAPGVEQAIGTLEHTSIDLVIADLKMTKVSGLELVKHVHENCPDVEAMMITGYPTIGSAVDAVKMGAEDYLAKPFTDVELYGADPQVSAVPRPSSDNGEHSTKFLGLCSNCDNRETCAYPKPEGGVWRCEEYV
jgi:DNA-binding NtrC family response regulator